jgi:hypothetical protein
MDLAERNGEDLQIEGCNEPLNHGLKVMLHLLQGWPSGRIVCADSYFASVQAAVELAKKGFHFIGVVKMATKLFPKDFLSSVQLKTWGSCIGVKATTNTNEDGEVDLLAFVFCDRNRQHFISSRSNISPGLPIQWSRVQQLADVETNEDLVTVDMILDCPKAACVYYTTCGKIDQHNRCWQDTLDLEKKLKTHHWERRVNMSIFGMIIVDSWMLYKGCTGGTRLQQSAYYKALIDDLIDCPLKSMPETRQSLDATAPSAAAWAVKVGTAGRGLHLTPTKRKGKSADRSNFRRTQRACRTCGSKKSWFALTVATILNVVSPKRPSVIQRPSETVTLVTRPTFTLKRN